MSLAPHALFGRTARVVMGPAGGPQGSGLEWDITPVAGLRIRFSVKKTGDATPNDALVTFYNLSESHRNFVDSYDKSTWAIQLFAGYQDTGNNLLFSGSMELASNLKASVSKAGRIMLHYKQGPDWITQIHGKDGVRNYRSTIMSKSFRAGVSQRSVVEEIARAMGMTRKQIDLSAIPDTAVMQNGIALCKTARDELNAICDRFNARASIQDGVLQIIPRGESLDREAFVLSPQTGLIGSPERTEVGVRVTSLLQGGINPGRLIEIQSQYLSGLYIAENVEHVGDTWEYSWYTTVDCIKA